MAAYSMYNVQFVGVHCTFKSTPLFTVAHTVQMLQTAEWRYSER